MAKRTHPEKRTPDLVDVIALDILSVTVSEDGRSIANVVFSLDVGDNLQVSLTPELLAKLERMLAEASMEQARVQPIH